jgi:hypothetical protein
VLGHDVTPLRLLEQLLRVRLRTAVLVCLPALVFCAWYIWRVESSLSAYRGGPDLEVPHNLEVFQLLLHDVLTRDVRVLTMEREPPARRIRWFDLTLSHRNRSRLLDSAREDGKRPYVPAKMVTKEGERSVHVQPRGDQPWHVFGASRTMRVGLPSGSLFDGHRVFNLIDDTSPFVVGEEIVLDLARSMDILAPRTSFARVSMNGEDLGVFHYETQPDESLLRMWHRIPGSMYAGDLKRGMPTDSLWTDPATWKKHAWRVEEERDVRPDLDRLLSMVSTATVDEFTEFARNEMDLDAFARFEALDIAFGSQQRDFRHNHRLYFDPYRGRWEPVAWRFDGFRHEAAFDLVENPILLRLKQVPEYPSLLAETLYGFLVEEGSVDSVRQRASKQLEALAPELTADRDWYAEHMLPRVDSFYRKLLRPMTLERVSLILASEMETYARRHAYLTRELARNRLDLSLEKREAALGAASLQRAELDLQGRSGIRVTGVSVTFADGCGDRMWTASLEGRGLVPETTASDVTLPVPVELFPAFGAETVDLPDDENGGIRFAPVSSRFELRFESKCGIEAMTITGVQLSTGSMVRAKASAGRVSGLQAGELPGSRVPSFEVGEPPYVAPPRWLMDRQPVRVGPGRVAVPETRVYSSDEDVEVEAGTEIEVGTGASLVFLGRVRMLGTEARPIVVRGADAIPWGGVALQGRGTSGSEFSHVTFRGGTGPSWRNVTYPAMVNVHDTKEVRFRDCVFENNASPLDLFHAAYVKGLRIEDSVVRNAAGDGIDLEYTNATIRGLTIESVGDDAVDLMGSKVDMRQVFLVGGHGYGLSAGEESRVLCTNLFAGGFEAGVLAKNASEVRLAATLLYRNRWGVRVYKRESRFEGDSSVRADEVFAVGNEHPTKLDGESRHAIQVTRLTTTLAADGSLEFLRDGVIGLESWTRLPGWFEEQMKKVPPARAERSHEGESDAAP